MDKQYYQGSLRENYKQCGNLPNSLQSSYQERCQMKRGLPGKVSKHLMGANQQGDGIDIMDTWVKMAAEV